MSEPARRSVWRRAAAMLAVLLGLPAAVLGAMILLGGPETPPPLSSVADAARALEGGDPPPEPERFTARDGTELAFRAYPAAGEGSAETVAVLIHGSAGSSLAMNRLAHGLARAGVAAYAPDMRGHGASGPRGQIDHVGRLAQDLIDLTVTVVRERHPDAALVLVGYSSGGGLALRMAAHDIGRAFARFVLLAPYLGHDAPTTRPQSGGWVDAGVPRIVALSILHRLGIDWLHHLPVLAFALPPARTEADDGLTRRWSFALMRAFGPGADPVADANAAHGPVELLVGAQDEIMEPDRYAAFLAPAGDRISVRVLPGLDHVGLIARPAGIAATVRVVASEAVTE